ncbi:MAG: F0F1 ATP synthase subunit A [Bacteroidia bacterium]|nr:F0F1 ATP synthase subunit A [Bacteroidia bacterium]
MIKKILLLALACILFFGVMRAQHNEEKEGEKFNASEVILHHILDSHDWHITDIPAGEENGKTKYTPVALHLPWILYSSRDGLKFYANTHALEADGKFALDHHGMVYAKKAGASGHDTHEKHDTPPVTHDTVAKTETHGGDTHGDKATTEEPQTKEAHAEEGHAIADKDETVSVLDFSITKTALQIILIGLIMVLVFTSVARGYVRNKGKAPSGLQSFFEPVIIFVRDLSKEYLGKNYEKFLPYQLTLFFFIWFSNLLGLTPLNSNIAGNISVTAALAILSFILINVNGSKDYWKHIFAAPGVPKPMLVLLTPVEVLGIFTKPFALAVRLFANIVAGHFMVLSLISLIFLLGDNGRNVAGATGGAVLGITFAIIIFCLEMLVAIIQAYIFTLLTTVFISMAMESHDDHHHDHHEEKSKVLNSEVNKDLRLSDFSVN